MQNEVREHSIRQQARHNRTGEGSVEGPQAGANEVEERPGGQCQASCQAHGLQQLLHMPTVWVNIGMDFPKHDPRWRQTPGYMGQSVQIAVAGHTGRAWCRARCINGPSKGLFHAGVTGSLIDV